MRGRIAIAAAGLLFAATMAGEASGLQSWVRRRWEVGKQRIGATKASYTPNREKAQLSGLGKRFRQHLASLDERHTWIDFGAGDENFLQLRYLGAQWPVKKVSVVGIHAGEPSAYYQRLRDELRFAKVPYRDRFLTGYRLEEYLPSEIPKAELATDHRGVVSGYSEAPDKTLWIELDHLQPGGVLYSHLVGQTAIVNEAGEDVSYDWLRAIEGAKLVELDGEDLKRRRFALERTEGPLRVPKLQPLLFQAGRPPARSFLWKDSGTIDSHEVDWAMRWMHQVRSAARKISGQGRLLADDPMRGSFGSWSAAEEAAVQRIAEMVLRRNGFDVPAARIRLHPAEIPGTAKEIGRVLRRARGILKNRSMLSRVEKILENREKAKQGIKEASLNDIYGKTGVGLKILYSFDERSGVAELIRAWITTYPDERVPNYFSEEPWEQEALMEKEK